MDAQHALGSLNGLDKALSQVNNRLSTATGFVNTTKQLDELELAMTKNGSIIDKVNKKFVSQDEVVRRVAARQDELAETANKAKENINGMDQAMLGFGLSILFGGMALKMFADRALKSLFTAYSTVMGEQSMFTKQTNKLIASFEFLKFSIVDALVQSDLFIPMIDFIVGLVNGISEFVNKEPGLAKLIITFLVLLSVLGLLGMIFGQLLLFGSAFTVGVALKTLSLVGAVLLLVTALTLLVVIWTSDMPLLSKITASLGIAILGVIGTMVLFGKVSRLMIGGTFLGLILLAITGLINLANAFGGVGNFFIAVAGGIAKGLVLMVYDPIELILSAVIELSNALARLASGLGLDGLARQFFAVREGAEGLRNVADDILAGTLTAVDEGLGLDKIREDSGVKDLETLLEAVLTGGVTNENRISSDMDAQNEELQSQLDTKSAIETMSGGASIADLKTEMMGLRTDIQNQSDVEGNQNNFTFNIDGLSSREEFESFIDDWFLNNRDRFTGSPG